MSSAAVEQRGIRAVRTCESRLGLRAEFAAVLRRYALVCPHAAFPLAALS